MQSETCAGRAHASEHHTHSFADSRVGKKPSRHFRKSQNHNIFKAFTQLRKNVGRGNQAPFGCNSSDSLAAGMIHQSQGQEDESAPQQHHTHHSPNVVDSSCSGNGHSHERQHCCQPHGPRNKILEKVLRATGILQLAGMLEEKVWVSAAITIFLLVAACINCSQGVSTLAGKLAQQTSIWAIYALAGFPEVVQLMFSVTAGHVNTHVLMTLACLATAFIGSAFEGALLLVLFNVSHTVEHHLTDKAQGSLTGLFDQIPQQAVLVDLDAAGSPRISDAREVSTSGVAVGSTVLVRPGQQVPLDGFVVYGEALVSTEHLTGEALPVRKGMDDQVLAGALNHDGLLVVKSTAPSSQSTPARIAELAQAAKARKPQLDRWLDKFSEVYARGVLGGTILSFLALSLAGVPALSTATQRGAVYRSVGLLTTASPCALVLVPLAYVAALACITRRGVLMRGTHVLDALAESSTIAFDKTGTLTSGNLSCSALHIPQSSSQNGSLPGVSSLSVQEAVRNSDTDTVSAVASMIALSERSTHPVSQAIQSLAQELQLPHVDITNFKSVSGNGVQGNLQRNGGKRHVRFGSAKYASGVLDEGQRARVVANAQDLASESVVSVLVDVAEPSGRQNGAHEPQHDIVRMFTFTDEVHPASKQALKHLQEGSWSHPRPGLRFATAMLTGDSKVGAARIAKFLGITNVHAGLSPEEKLEHIDRVRNEASARGGGGAVIMVGDGINDAPALAAADVGIAIASSPTEAASSAADVVILRGDGISALPFILRVAHQTRKIVKQNLVLALAAILALSLPVLSGAIPLWFAVALHEGSTLLVALNSLRLLYFKDNLAATFGSHRAVKSQGPFVSSQEGRTASGGANNVIPILTGG